MSSTTSRRLRRVYELVGHAHRTGRTSIDTDHLEAALAGGSGWDGLDSELNPPAARVFDWVQNSDIIREKGTPA